MSTPASSSDLILVVDDDEDLRAAIAEVLEDCGYATAQVTDGAAALAWLEAQTAPPALLLVDMMMPVMDGLAFRAALRTRPAFTHLPLIFLTASQRERFADAVAPDRLVTKPVSLANLIAAVESSLRDRRR